MIISPNENGWSFDESHACKLVHDGTNIIIFEETDKSISTQNVLYVGTKEECEEQIKNLDLKYPEQPQEEDIV